MLGKERSPRDRTERVRTLCELPAVELAGLELDGDDVSEGFMEELDGDAETGGHCFRE